MGRKCVVGQLVFVVILTMAVPSFALGCHDTERQALSKFKLSFSDPDNLLSSWKGMNCCDWVGVGCDDVTGYVNYLRLVDLGSGPLTAQKLDPSLIELRHLEQLDLSLTDFQGSQIPGFIGSFKHLNFLDLSDANFSAIIPPQLGNLTQLQYLYFSGPERGYLQWAPALVNSQHRDMNDVLVSNTRNIVQVLSRLTSLKCLLLYSCGLTSSPHLYSLLSNSTWNSRIETLDLSYNVLAGPLPNVLANMSSLVYLGLSNNFLNGSIPLWVRNLKNIETLHLSQNSFSCVKVGIVIGFFGSLSNLKFLDLSSNSLAGELLAPHVNFSKAITPGLLELSLNDNEITGSLPSWLGEYKNLTILTLDNNRISGHIPASIGNLSALKILSLSNNSLGGAIPEGLGQLNNLKTFDISWNHLEGVVSSSHFANLSSLNTLALNNNPLNVTFSTDWSPSFQLTSLDLNSCGIGPQFPKWIASQTNLQYLTLSSTDISGELPPFLCQLSQLYLIDVQSNKLFGTIPDCWRSKSLKLINLSSNKLSGPIPESIGLLATLSSLILNNNSLEGRIPPTFSSLSNLTIMDLGENKLSGGIPDWRPNSLPYLKILRLRSNKLVGFIPEHVCSLPSTQLLDVANNQLTGTIPICFGDLSGMSLNSARSTINLPPNDDKSLYMSDDESVTEVLKGVELQYTRNLKFLVNLDLSCNRLVGSIPETVTNLSGLIGLNFSHNYLTGGIPEKIGEMGSLESLDLSNNHLSGTIPPSLSQLTFLIGFNLSNNELHGQIPTGNQLQALTNPLMIYGGNPGLCGDPLPNKCKSNHVQQQPQESNTKNGSEKLLLYFVIFSGFATGFWGVVGSLLLNRRFRFALFQLVSKIADYFYVQVMVRVNRLRN